MFYNSSNYTLYYKVFNLITFNYFFKYVYWSCKSHTICPCFTQTKYLCFTSKNVRIFQGHFVTKILIYKHTVYIYMYICKAILSIVAI